VYLHAHEAKEYLEYLGWRCCRYGSIPMTRAWQKLSFTTTTAANFRACTSWHGAVPP